MPRYYEDADVSRLALQKLSRGQALNDEEAKLIGYTQPTTPVAVTSSTRTGLTSSDYGPGKIPTQAQPKPLTGLNSSYAELLNSIQASKNVSAAETIALAEAQMDVGAAAEAKVEARTTAEKIAAETGSKIDPVTGIITPNPNLKKKVIVEDPNANKGGNNQFVEYEYNSTFTKRRAKYFNSATGQFTYGEWEDVPKTKEDYDKEQAAAAAAAKALQEKRDAFALIEATMRSYGFTDFELNEIMQFIQKGLMDPNMGPNQLTLALRQLPSYKARFAGNEERRARGLNALSEGEYLQQEQDYSATFRQRGLQRFVSRGQFATLIGNDISNTELGKRVDLAVERVQYGDPRVLQQLKTYYNITETDIAAYYLNPKEVLPELEAKTTTAEIGSAAAQYGFQSERERAEGLRAFGVDLTRARAGYGLIAERLPRTQELSNIYKQMGINYTQTTAEEEEFKGTASAKRAREKLKELEIGSFMGSGGTSKVSLSRGTAGLI